jgi:O-antigen/teichoic acid export membrane protein
MISTVVFPFVASGSQPGMRNRLSSYSRKLVWLYVGLCTLLAATGYWLFPFVYGETFSKMYIAFLLIIPGILAISALYPYTAFFSGENKIIVNIKGSLLAFVFIAAADYFLIPRYGIYAASAISSVGYFIYYCYVFVVFQKEGRN